MEKSSSVSSEGSAPLSPLDDEVSSVCSDELLGSQSRLWLSDMLSGSGGNSYPEIGDPNSATEALGAGLFVDTHFPRGVLELQIGAQWKRPKDICRSPQFIVDGATRLDVRQGKLNNCWFLSAISSLALNRSLLKKVVPLDQSFDHNYNGCFTFRFWQYGQWVEVRVDDLLPTVTMNGSPRLVYLSSPDRQEFWSCLLEKAYAKLKGGYRALDMGFPYEAMLDMTGGVTEVLSVSNLPRDTHTLHTLLRRLLHRGALINCANTKGPLEQDNGLGIMYRHAYALTALEKVQSQYGPVYLVRIMNPWGKVEWEGPWSDLKGPEWNTVSKEEQKRLQRVRREDGEFWMSVSDFRQNFENLEVCHMTESLGQSGSSVRPWTTVMHHGNWVPGVSAGGPRQNSNFSTNPQYAFSLSEVDSEPSDPDQTCSFIVALMQKHQRISGNELAIALHIYKAHPQTVYLSRDDLTRAQPIMWSKQYLSHHEVILRGSSPPGRYIIVPSTSQANQSGAFLLRVLADHGNDNVPAAKPPQDIQSSPVSYPHQAALPSPKEIKEMFKKHCNKKGFCKPVHLLNLLTEAIQGGVLSGSEKYLALEHCKSLVILMDSQISAQLSWRDFMFLWDKIRRWTDIFMVFDKNKSKHLEYKEVSPALKAAGISVDELIMQLVGLRYTEPDLTISYPGFLYLVMKLESMTQKFQAFDVARAGYVTLSQREWLRMTMYN